VSKCLPRTRVPVPPTVVFADPSEDSRDALREGRSATDVRAVADGAEPLDYLGRAGAVSPPPSLAYWLETAELPPAAAAS
jgi:hypothetical protein